MKHAALIARLARGTVGFIWIYHGLVTKILARDADEFALLAAGGISAARQLPALLVVGALETLFGLVILCCGRTRWPLALSALAMVGATAGVAVTAPHFLTTAFNALTFNCAVAALSVIALLGGPSM